jgi:hypothetical protein
MHGAPRFVRFWGKKGRGSGLEGAGGMGEGTVSGPSLRSDDDKNKQRQKQAAAKTSSGKDEKQIPFGDDNQGDYNQGDYNQKDKQRQEQRRNNRRKEPGWASGGESVGGASFHPKGERRVAAGGGDGFCGRVAVKLWRKALN